MKCITVMPVYNEASCLQETCREWIEEMEKIGGCLLVVDDGSHDASPSILADLASGHKLLRVVRQENAGHGAAVLSGYRHALADGSEWIFQVDADGEMPARLFQKIWLMRHKAPILLGTRLQRSTGPIRTAGSAVHRLLLKALFGVEIPDPNVPFRLMRSAELKQLLARIPEGVFAPNVFLTLLAARSGHLGIGPDIQMARRAGGASSIRGFQLLPIAIRCWRELWSFRQGQWLDPGGISG
jgi:glycosyltransferase involved in cell wall biosynthesis